MTAGPGALPEGGGVAGRSLFLQSLPILVGTGRRDRAEWTPGPRRSPLLPESTNLAGTGRRVCARNIPGLYRQHPTVGADSGSAVGATGAASPTSPARCSPGSGLRHASRQGARTTEPGPAILRGEGSRLEPQRWRRDAIVIHDVVIHDVMEPGRGNGEQGSVLELCGVKCRAKRPNRGFLLAITGIIASKNQFCTDSAPRQRIVG